MKKTFRITALSLFLGLAVISCKKKNSDADLTTKATTAVVSYPTASVEVKEGTAHLSGSFATTTERDAAIASLKNIEGIKDVHDMATILPTADNVVVNVVDPVVLQKVTDALKDISGVKAESINGILTITGTTSSADARKVKESIDALKIGKYDNKIVIK